MEAAARRTRVMLTLRSPDQFVMPDHLYLPNCVPCTAALAVVVAGGR